MVYRIRPSMTAEEGTRRRTKILIAFGILCFVLAGYYLYSYSRENMNLKKKQVNLNTQLRKYGGAYSKCERSLKTSRNDAQNFHESNKHLQAKVTKQEEELANSEKTNADISLKLDQSYQFYRDVSELLGNDPSQGEDKQITPEAAVSLKQEIQKLKSDHTEYEKLKSQHDDVSKAFGELKLTHEDLRKRTGELETRSKEVTKSNRMMKGEIKKYRKEIIEKSQTINNLELKVRKLLAEKRMSKIAKTLVASSPPATLRTSVPPATPSPAKVEKPEESSSERRIVVEPHVSQKTIAAETPHNSPTDKPVTKKDAPVTKKDAPVAKEAVNGSAGASAKTADAPADVPADVPANEPADAASVEAPESKDGEESNTLDEEGETEEDENADDTALH